MTKYRHLINIGLFLAQVVPTIYFIYYIIVNSGTHGLRSVLGFVFLIGLTITLFKNKNVFTLLLGLTLLVGNFTGITVFETLTKYDFFLNIGYLPIPLYWGAPFYSVLLLIYIVFNKGFYTGIATKEYWADFLTRTNNENKNSSGQVDEM